MLLEGIEEIYKKEGFNGTVAAAAAAAAVVVVVGGIWVWGLGFGGCGVTGVTCGFDHYCLPNTNLIRSTV